MSTDDAVAEFRTQCDERAAGYTSDKPLLDAAAAFVRESARARYTYNFTWLGRPVIQYPQDLIALQEVIWRVRPDLIVETGIAHGGSLIFSASMLQLLGDGIVVGIDVDIRPHNRREIESHPLAPRIRMIEGSSVDPEIVRKVEQCSLGKRSVLVILDSNHTHEHVLKELVQYSPLVTVGSYLIVMDTVVEEMPAGFYPDRPWDKGNNPWTAVQAFLPKNDAFEIDEAFQNKLLVTMCRDGFLRRVR